ncbi:hypothetical protein EJB05_37839, partial [Eragrostis curvula]
MASPAGTPSSAGGAATTGGTSSMDAPSSPARNLKPWDAMDISFASDNLTNVLNRMTLEESFEGFKMILLTELLAMDGNQEKPASQGDVHHWVRQSYSILYSCKSNRNLKPARSDAYTYPSPAVDAFRPTARDGCLTGGGSIPAAGGGACSWRSTWRCDRLPVRARSAPRRAEHGGTTTRCSSAARSGTSWLEATRSAASPPDLNGARLQAPLRWRPRGAQVAAASSQAAANLVPRQHRRARGQRSPGYAAPAGSSFNPKASKGGCASGFDLARRSRRHPRPKISRSCPLRVECQFRTDPRRGRRVRGCGRPPQKEPQRRSWTSPTSNTCEATYVDQCMSMILEFFVGSDNRNNLKM